MNKQELRVTLRAVHEGNRRRGEQSERMCRHILESDWYRNAQVIGGYMPMPHEADVYPVLMKAMQQGKTLALPLCGKKPDMTFHRVCSFQELVPGAYGIPEPAVDTPIVPIDAIDLLLVPLEGIDRDGYRLGKGGGYYDKALAKCPAKTLGCALGWQWVEKIPHDPWDMKLHACADEKGIHKFIT